MEQSLGGIAHLYHSSAENFAMKQSKIDQEIHKNGYFLISKLQIFLSGWGLRPQTTTGKNP